MKLIVGLGNPGEKYKNNRHNVGYMFIDYIINKLTSSRVNEFKIDKKINSQLTKLAINNIQLLFAKPLTFMNNSGKAVQKIVTSYKLQVANDLMVVHDDLDIPLGKFKIQQGTGPKLHNGIESIENHLHARDFWRIRIGIDNRMNTGMIDGESYTLQDFNLEEKKVIEEIFPKILDRLKEQLSFP